MEQFSHFHRRNATKLPAHVSADTISRLVTVATTAVGITGIYYYFSVVVISLPGTAQLYHLDCWL